MAAMLAILSLVHRGECVIAEEDGVENNLSVNVRGSQTIEE